MRKPSQSWVRVVALSAMALACASCASIDATLPGAKYPDDLQKEAAYRCEERRGGDLYVPNREFRTDGCTLWPDSNWQSCCIEHDMAYWCGGSAGERKDADREIRECVADTGHPVMGSLMSGVIRITGSRIFPTTWRWAFGWPWIGAMQRDDSAESAP